MENYAKWKEEVVITAAQAGDEDAIEFLLHKYQGLLGHICEKYYLKGGEKEDLMQEAMIGFMQAIENYRAENGKSFKNFAIMCARRELDSCVRRANRKKHAVLNDAISIYSVGDEQEEDAAPMEMLMVEKNRFDEPLTPESILLEKEDEQEATFSMLKMLSNLEYKVLLMRMMGYSYNEITLLLQLESKSVDNAMQRIRKKFSKNRIQLGY